MIFSPRKGVSYATLLAGMQDGRPVDVLPDREVATLQGWLAGHPEVEVVSRVRAGAYARDGAPQAAQVADRWHLWHTTCASTWATFSATRACSQCLLAIRRCLNPAQGQRGERTLLGAGDEFDMQRAAVRRVQVVPRRHYFAVVGRSPFE
jgi:hypothetical protein